MSETDARCRHSQAAVEEELVHTTRLQDADIAFLRRAVILMHYSFIALQMAGRRVDLSL